MFPEGANSQPAAKPDPIAMVTACITAAIQSGSVVKSNGDVRLTCVGGAAGDFYNLLGQYGANTTEGSIAGGKYHLRKMSGLSECGIKYQEANGNAVNLSFCNLYLPIGDALTK